MSEETTVVSPLQTQLERVMLVVALIGPLGTVPQVVKVFFTHTHHVHGLSLTTWGSFTLISMMWLAYGVVFRRTALIVANILYVVVNGAVVTGILMYSNSLW